MRLCDLIEKTSHPEDHTGFKCDGHSEGCSIKAKAAGGAGKTQEMGPQP